jgi:PAS domain-containing protein
MVGAKVPKGLASGGDVQLLKFVKLPYTNLVLYLTLRLSYYFGSGWNSMAPGQIEEIAALQRKIVELETQVEKMRRSDEQQFRHMADCAPFPIWSAGTDAMRTFVNRAWLEFRGRTPQQEMGS